MNYHFLKENFPALLARSLPGEAAQRIMAPDMRGSLQNYQAKLSQAKKAAVLAVLENYNNETYLIVTLRKTYKGVHSGQISLPGGKKEFADQSFLATALRETHEEIGVAPSALSLASPLSPIYIPPSNYYVEPFVAFADAELTLVPEEKEVEKIYRLPLKELLNQENTIATSVQVGTNSRLNTPAFLINKLTIWGATAMILSELKEVLRPLQR